MFLPLVLAAACSASSTPTGPAAPASGVRTYAEGSRWVLERVEGPDTVRLALESAWGATIVEASLNGENFVNHWDDGREIQVSFFDGQHAYDPCAGCSGVWGWNPVQGGDRHNQGSPVLAHSLDGSSIYAKVRPNEWLPDNKGGGKGWPVASDLIMEQWVSVAPEHPRAFRVRFRATHVGSDEHAPHRQEFPAVYTNRGYERFVYYGGSAPWTGDAPASAALGAPHTKRPEMRATEPWGALVNERGQGVTVFTPGDYAFYTGFNGVATGGSGGAEGTDHAYFAPFATTGFGPGEVFEGEYYIVLGDVGESRATVYALQRAQVSTDRFTPYMALDLPGSGSLSRTVEVVGWAFDNQAVERVEVYLDGAPVGPATYGHPRADVGRDWPGVPQGIGYRYLLDTRGFANGPHRLRVKATDGSGRYSWKERVVTIAN